MPRPIAPAFFAAADRRALFAARVRAAFFAALLRLLDFRPLLRLLLRRGLRYGPRCWYEARAADLRAFLLPPLR